MIADADADLDDDPATDAGLTGPAGCGNLSEDELDALLDDTLSDERRAALATANGAIKLSGRRGNTTLDFMVPLRNGAKSRTR